MIIRKKAINRGEQLILLAGSFNVPIRELQEIKLRVKYSSHEIEATRKKPLLAGYRYHGYGDICQVLNELTTERKLSCLDQRMT